MNKIIPLLLIIFSFVAVEGINDKKVSENNTNTIDSIKNPQESTINSINQKIKTDSLDESKTHKESYCFYDNLSDKYNYQVNVFRSGREDNWHEPDSITIYILNKSDNKILQTIGITPGLLYYDSYTDCNNVKSNITKFNPDRNLFEYPYSELIIGNFNFDSLEDFAIMVDEGGNCGAIYQYYIQDSKGVFHKDSFLSEEMLYFPVDIDNKYKTLKTLVHKDAFGAYEKEYKYDDKNKSWKFVKQTYRGR